MTRAEFHQDLLEMVATLNEAAGTPVLSVLHSPVIPPDPAHIPAMFEVRDRVVEYLELHPDTIQGTPKSPTYNWDFVGFIVDLLAPGQPGSELSYAELTAATNVPLETLYNWLHRKPHRIRQHD